MTKCSRYPLMMDPQNQANTWLKKMYKETIQVCKQSDKNFQRILENGLKFGNKILVENLGELVDPVLDPILARQLYKKGAVWYIKVGDQEISYNSNFHLMLTSKLQNPHYLPEVSIKVTLINFTVSSKGLEDQLLMEVIKIERAELEEQKDLLIVSISEDNKQLKELQDKILRQIAEIKGNILDDEEIIQTLDASKVTYESINVRMTEAKKTTKDIEQAREKYRQIARRGSTLYFIITDLPSVDPMYQYSLDYFINLFKRRIRQTEKSEEVEERRLILIEDINLTFYQNICRGLFERHKLLYSFLMSVNIEVELLRVPRKHWEMFIMPPDEQEAQSPLDFLDASTFNYF